MRPLGVTLVLASGRGRIALVMATTALACALVLVAVSMARLWTVDPSDAWATGHPYGGLLGPIADSGTRAGAVVGTLLLVLPLVLLLDQAVRLGSSSRRTRYAALSVAGADSRDLRRWGAVEVGAPALAGALLGVPLWLLLRQVLGVGLRSREAALVPTTVGPGGWTWLVVALVAAYGALVGWRLGARTAAGVERSRDPRPPRPWGLLLLAAAVAGFFSERVAVHDLAPILVVVLLAVALASLGPWLAWVAARTGARRAGSAALLLAARRLAADPRPAGRAAAAVGAVGLSLGAAAAFVADILVHHRYDVAYYVVPAVIAGVCALAALGVIAVALAVHSTETVLERRRELATLVATGVPAGAVSRSQLLECLVATVPLAVLGAAIGGFGYASVVERWVVIAPWALAAVVLTGLAAAGACWAVTAAMAPWVSDAVAPEHLRTA
ncbi:hypothetical protein [Nocardioides sp. SYSU DS0663]|uniref:hypothetical protein n=1 Tax=Nocardioides sp. SYSU DS0663 TaxID=3416445 RepID=UPI003F4BFE2F